MERGKISKGLKSVISNLSLGFRTNWFGKITEIDEKLVSAKQIKKKNSISVDAFEDKQKTSDLTA